jgi:DNA-binding transcriptional LysR family regulator
MNIYARNLEIFVNLENSGSLTRTAKQMFMTQPAVSTAIKNLENYYWATLLQRGSHRMDLTGAGSERI